MEIRKKENKEAKKETPSLIELFVDKVTGKIKWLDRFRVEKVIATEEYVTTTISTNKPYKELIYALDADNSGGDPSGTEGINDYLTSPTFANTGTGSYSVTLTGAFAGIVTHCEISIFPNSISSEVNAYIIKSNDNLLTISITDGADAAINGFQGTIHIITVPNV